MKNINLFLSWRYLWGTRQEKNIATMVLICSASIMIGTFALALILAIMNGFEHVTHEKLRGIHAQVIMRAYGSDLNVKEIAKVLHDEFPEVIAFSPTTFKHGLIQSAATDDMSNVVMIKAINPEQEKTISTLEEKITRSIDNKKTLRELLNADHVLIGEKLAREIGVVPGEPATLLFSGDTNRKQKKITFQQHPTIVSGTFKTGIDEFDSGLIIGSFELLQELWPETGVEQINLKLAPGTNEANIIKALHERFGIEVYSWQDLYPALVAALKLEKYAMFFIIALIALVASMNIISLEFMHITQKRGDIAILKAMGMRNASITSIFLGIGCSIACFASLIGLALAGAVGWILESFPFIELPDVYYVSHLPIKMEWHLFLLVFVVVMLLSFIATWVPARAAQKINIAQVLRFEA